MEEARREERRWKWRDGGTNYATRGTGFLFLFFCFFPGNLWMRPLCRSRTGTGCSGNEAKLNMSPHLNPVSILCLVDHGKCDHSPVPSCWSCSQSHCLLALTSGPHWACQQSLCVGWAILSYIMRAHNKHTMVILQLSSYCFHNVKGDFYY